MAASLRRQGLRAKPPGSSARSATAHTTCLSKICWSRIFTPVVRTRSGQETSRTYVQMKAGLSAVVIDLWSRAVIGWSMSPRRRNWPAMPCRWRCGGVKRPRTLSFTRTVEYQYCSADYQAQLKRHNLRGSMSAKGCCYDNACVESFFHSLEVECIHRTLRQGK